MRHPVPWITQYASPSLIEAISFQGRPRTDDPRWRESGAPDLETYGAWCSRWCGMACFRMALLARDGVAPSLYELAVGCAEYGAYVDGPDKPRGLIYRPFAKYARDKHALQAEVITELDPARLAAELDAGRLVIASVSSQIRRPESEPAKTGGHLVLVTGHADGQVTFHDPAGHTPEAGVATLPMPVFDRFAAHRGVALQL
ncbi:MAG TPA: C39 family peptidase [Trebonia sp.]|nr:C39 family peptidase [Trebonia sp.]